jgi:hypothetical protein
VLTVWTMNTGRHAPDEEVRTLKRQVDRHLSEPHIFQCISEHKIEGIHHAKPLNDLPGWWGKTNLFSGNVSHSRNLWLDLDVTITRSIDGLVAPLQEASDLRTVKNWPLSGHGGCQSSVMYWEGTKAKIISDSFDHDIAHWPPINRPGTLWGDQEWLTQLMDENKVKVEWFDADDVVSYKYHCVTGLPKHSRIQVFHGKPDPSDVSDEWVRYARAGGI